MKKIITLAGAILLYFSSFAQYHSDNEKRYDDNDRERDVVYNDNRHDRHNDRRDDRYTFNNRERDKQIDRVNREYDRKIEMVHHKWFMNRSKKQSIIYSLEEKRRYELRNIYEKYNRRNNRFDDHHSRKH